MLEFFRKLFRQGEPLTPADIFEDYDPHLDNPDVWKDHVCEDRWLTARFRIGRCPDCGSDAGWFEGPQALEITVNLFCANRECGAGFVVHELPSGDYVSGRIKEPKFRATNPEG